MKKSSLTLVALLVASSVFADPAQQPLTLASADTSVSVNLKSSEATDLGARVDQEVKNVSDALSAKIEAELSAKIANEAVANVKF
jgi:hypothetical protein